MARRRGFISGPSDLGDILRRRGQAGGWSPQPPYIPPSPPPMPDMPTQRFPTPEGPSGPIIYDPGPREWPTPPGPGDEMPEPPRSLERRDQQSGFLPVPDDPSRNIRVGPNGEWFLENPDPRIYAGTQWGGPGDPGTPTDPFRRYEPMAGWELQNAGLPAWTGFPRRPSGSVPIAASPEAAQQAASADPTYDPNYNPLPPGTVPPPGWDPNDPNSPPWDNRPPGDPDYRPELPPEVPPEKGGPPATGPNWYDDGINKSSFMGWMNDPEGGGRFEANNKGIRALVKEINTYENWDHVKVVEGNQKWKHKVDFGKDIGVIDLIGNAASMGGGTWQWLKPGGGNERDTGGGLPRLPYAGGEIGPSFSPSDFPTLTLPRAEYAPYATGDPFSYDDFRAPSFAEARNEPGYEFARSEGLRALENAAGARGMTRTGSALKDVVGWGNRFAGQNYGDVYKRSASDYDRNRQNAFNQWAGNEQQRLDAYTTSRDTRRGVFDRNTRNLQAEFDPRFEATKLSFNDRYRRWKDGLTSFTQLAMMPDPLT